MSERMNFTRGPRVCLLWRVGLYKYMNKYLTQWKTYDKL